jgi:hypothetical protein
MQKQPLHSDIHSLSQLALAHMYMSLSNQMPVPVASVSGGYRCARPCVYTPTSAPRLIPIQFCSDIQVPDWMAAASGVAVSLPQVVGVSADHQCIVWCHQAVVHMAQALRHLAASDGQARGEAGVRHREEALQAWFSPTKKQPSTLSLAATAAPVVVASLLALPTLCLMHVFVCAAAGARPALPSIALVACSALRSLVTSAPPVPLLVVAALLVARLCGSILGDALVDAVSWVGARWPADSKKGPPLGMHLALQCAALMAGAPVLGSWLLGAQLLVTGARHSRLCAQLAVAYAWAAVCAAPAAAAWAQVRNARLACWGCRHLTSPRQVGLVQGWRHRPRSSQADVVLAMAAWAGALRVVRNARPLLRCRNLLT